MTTKATSRPNVAQKTQRVFSPRVGKRAAQKFARNAERKAKR